jgi:acyl-coenzyme A thioesterase PaaI-like protein
LRAEHGEQVGIFGLVAREGGSGGHHAAKRFVVGFVSGGASCAAIDYGANRDRKSMVGYVLMDGVIGEAGEGVSGGVNLNFSFIRRAERDYTVCDALEFRESKARAVLGDGSAA